MKKWETIGLAQSRKAQDASGNRLPKQAGEVDIVNSKGEVKEYRKAINPNLKGFQINKINTFTFEWVDGKKPNTKFSLIVTKNEKVHIIDLGGGMVAKSVINSLCSLKDKAKEDLSSALFSLGVYVNKKGYNSASFKMNDEPLNWAFSMEEQNALIERTKNSKGEVVDTDDSAYVDQLKAYASEMNTILPATQYTDMDDGFDDIDTDYPEAVTTDDAEELFADAPAKTPVPVQDQAPKMNIPVSDKALDVPFAEGL